MLPLLSVAISDGYLNAFELFTIALILPELSNMIIILAGTSDVPVPGGGLLALAFKYTNDKRIVKIIFEYRAIFLIFHYIY